MCKTIEDMKKDTSVRAYAEACRDFGMIDNIILITI